LPLLSLTFKVKLQRLHLSFNKLLLVCPELANKLLQPLEALQQVLVVLCQLQVVHSEVLCPVLVV
jgi:hypothetical protein